MKNIGYMGLLLVLCMALALPAYSQAPQPQAKDRTEYDAYLAFYNEQNPQTKATLGEKFITDFANSEFLVATHAGLVRAYAAAETWAKVMETADRFEALPETPFKTAGIKMTVLETALGAAQQTGNFDKIVLYGDKILAADPNNLNAQLILSAMIPERLPDAPAAKTAALTKSMDLAKRAHDQVEALFKGPKPEGIPDAQWAEQKVVLDAQTHATLGLIHYIKEEYDDSVSMYEYVVTLTPKDQRAQMLLGIGYSMQATEAQKRVLEAYDAENAAIAARADQFRVEDLKAQREALEVAFREKRDKAIDALAKAVALPDAGFTASARTQLERLYRNKNNDSLDGLDALIAQKRAELG